MALQGQARRSPPAAYTLAMAWRSRFTVRLLQGLLLVLVSASAPAQTRRYAIDPVHTRIAFLIDHAGFSRAIGTFSGITGHIDYDPEHPAAARVEATVPIASLDLGDAEWNARMLERRYFHVGRYPQARFVSTAVEAGPGNTLKIRGELTLRGVVREIEFVATLNADTANRLTFKRTLGASAEFELARGEFRMGAYPTVIGSHARVLIELEAIRQPRDGGGRDEDPE